MAKTEIRLKSGTVVTIEGDPEEVARVIHSIQKGQRTGKEASEDAPKGAKKKAIGAREHIENLLSDGYFDAARAIGDVSKALEQQGYFYPTTSLSGPLLKMVRAKRLRRVRIEGNWSYSKAEGTANEAHV